PHPRPADSGALPAGPPGNLAGPSCPSNLTTSRFACSSSAWPRTQARHGDNVEVPRAYHSRLLYSVPTRAGCTFEVHSVKTCLRVRRPALPHGLAHGFNT